MTMYLVLSAFTFSPIYLLATQHFKFILAHLLLHGSILVHPDFNK